MKTNKIILFLFLLISIISKPIYSLDTIKVATGEWVPFTSEVNQSGRLTEVILEEALELVDLKVEYVYFPWLRVYDFAKKGESHATILWSYSEKRAKDFIYSQETLIEAPDVIFHLKSFDFKWENLEDLKKYRVGATKGYNHVNIYKKYGVETEEVVNEILNFKKLLAGRIDIYATQYYVGYNLIKTEFGEEKAKLFTHSKKPFRSASFKVMISRNIPDAQELADRIDLGLERLKESGRYDEIVEDFLK